MNTINNLRYRQFLHYIFNTISTHLKSHDLPPIANQSVRIYWHAIYSCFLGALNCPRQEDQIDSPNL